MNTYIANRNHFANTLEYYYSISCAFAWKGLRSETIREKLSEEVKSALSGNTKMFKPDTDLDEYYKVFEDITGVVKNESRRMTVEFSSTVDDLNKYLGNYCLPKTYELSEDHFLSHIIFLATFVETLSNWYLFELQEEGTISSEIYTSLDRVEVLPKILFALKEPILLKKLSVDGLKLLFKKRNIIIHYKKGEGARANASY